MRSDIAVRTADDRPARKSLSAFRSDEIDERHEHAVLFGDVACQALPAFEIGWNRSFVRSPPHPARRGCGDDEHHRGAVQRGHGSSEAMPGVFADQHGCAPPIGVESAHFESAIHKSLLVEQAVRRQEELAMNVADASPPSVT